MISLISTRALNRLFLPIPGIPNSWAASWKVRLSPTFSSTSAAAALGSNPALLDSSF